MISPLGEGLERRFWHQLRFLFEQSLIAQVDPKIWYQLYSQVWLPSEEQLEVQGIQSIEDGGDND